MSPPPLETLQAVTFDCWGTLLVERDWPAAHALRVDAVQEVARASERDTSREEARAAFDDAWARHMALWSEGVATGAAEVATWALEALGLAHPFPLAHLTARFEEASHSGRVTALDGARETLAGLRRAGIRCGLVCDTGLTPGRVVRAHLEAQGLLAHLEPDALAFSDEVGEPKPSERIFRVALAPLLVAPEKAAHVGDLRAHDVLGARRLGMQTIRIRALHDDETPIADADVVVADHAELAAVLGSALDGD